MTLLERLWVENADGVAGIRILEAYRGTTEVLSPKHDLGLEGGTAPNPRVPGSPAYDWTASNVKSKMSSRSSMEG
ncbi:hypothetical protein FA13DRAFT_1732586 [Coprinellus micaceus]|uniref:Uncharacterized protein n=1 Tax=Coprinellus micaceus TaxID=71717 RepID=A0A4Y7TDQ7_COPMI|nr:hypothetical protein FA13DRAFT_1732586 [Coprinellus micaceus]